MKTNVIHKIKVELAILSQILQDQYNNSTPISSTPAGLVEQLVTSNFKMEGSHNFPEVTSLLTRIACGYYEISNQFINGSEHRSSFIKCYLNLISLRNELK